METDARHQLKVTLFYRTQYKGSSEFRHNIKQKLPMHQLETDQSYISKSDTQKLIFELSWTWRYISNHGHLIAEILDMYNATVEEKNGNAMDLSD